MEEEPPKDAEPPKDVAGDTGGKRKAVPSAVVPSKGARGSATPDATQARTRQGESRTVTTDKQIAEGDLYANKPLTLCQQTLICP